MVGEALEKLPSRPPAAPDETPRTYAQIRLKEKRSLEQTHLCLGVPIYPLPHEKRYACYVLNTILGGSMSSRLFQNIRERQGLVYAVMSELNTYRDSASLVVSAGTSTERARQVVSLILQELRRMKEELLSEDELRLAKDHLKGSLIMSLETTSSRMSNLARQELFFGRFFTVDELAEAVEAVTAEEVQKVAAEFFRQELITLCLLGRLDGLQVEREELLV